MGYVIRSERCVCTAVRTVVLSQQSTKNTYDHLECLRKWSTEIGLIFNFNKTGKPKLYDCPLKIHSVEELQKWAPQLSVSEKHWVLEKNWD